MSDDTEFAVRVSIPGELSEDATYTERPIEAAYTPGGYRITGISSEYFDSNGFLNSWGPITFQNNVLSTELAAGTTGAEIQSTTLGNNEVGIYVDIIEGSEQYTWDLANSLGTFNLYSPIQNFPTTYPAISTDSITAYGAEYSILYDNDELSGLSQKFGTLATSETAKTHIIAKTKELASMVASKRKKKLTFTKAANSQQITTADFYSIQTAEVNSQVSVDIASTTGSFNRPAESQTSGRTTYSSYGGSSY